jgi:hypothetical protein
MLFYESAKALHGRMTQFKGKYYGSIFLHYQPVDESIWNYNHDVSVHIHYTSACHIYKIISLI